MCTQTENGEWFREKKKKELHERRQTELAEHFNKGRKKSKKKKCNILEKYKKNRPNGTRCKAYHYFHTRLERELFFKTRLVYVKKNRILLSSDTGVHSEEKTNLIKLQKQKT